MNQAEILTEKATNTIPAGGSESDRFDIQQAWYPIHYAEDLDKTKPTSFTLLDKDLVIWWDKSDSTWRVFIDQCPHRLARLSEGRINENGCIECPYHGWAFSGSGKCEIIPQQVEGNQAEKSKRASAITLPTIIKQGLLFVYPGNPELAFSTQIPIVEPLEESPNEWICINTFRDLPYDAFTLLENVLDVSHIPYTHHGTVGNRSNVAPVELSITETNKHGFKGIWEEGPRKGKLGTQYTTFIAPTLMYHDLTSKQFGRTLTVVYATPISKGKCRLFARFPFKFSSKLPGLFISLTPRWYSHINQNTILEDDQIFLHHQERYLEQAGGSIDFTKAFYLPTKADAYVFEFRKWLNQYQVEPFPQEKFPPALDKETLLERYYSHTIHCSSCSKAFSNIQQARKILLIILGAFWTFMPLVTVLLDSHRLLTVSIATGITIICGMAWLILTNFSQKMRQGQAIPPRNLA